jgi:hypothetical protein
LDLIPGFPLPRRLLQPTLDPLLKTVTHLLELIPKAGRFALDLVAPTSGSAQKFLTHTGLRQGKVIQPLQGRKHLSWLLIHNPIRTEPPTAAAWEAGITAADQVVKNPPCFELNRCISHGANGFAMAIQQGSVNQGGQALHGGLIRGGGIPLDQSLQLRKAPQLVETPYQPSIAKRCGLGHPTEHTMNRRMHPHGNPSSLIRSIGAMHATTEHITQQNLLRKGQSNQLRI